jgi:hypothetical protein
VWTAGYNDTMIDISQQFDPTTTQQITDRNP